MNNIRIKTALNQSRHKKRICSDIYSFLSESALPKPDVLNSTLQPQTLNVKSGILGPSTLNSKSGALGPSTLNLSHRQ